MGLITYAGFLEGLVLHGLWGRWMDWYYGNVYYANELILNFGIFILIKPQNLLTHKKQEEE